MDEAVVVRFWYFNHRQQLEYRIAQIEAKPVYIEAPGFNYKPGWFMNGLALDRDNRPYRSFSLDRKNIGFADPTHWTALGNCSPVANCAKAFGVDLATAYHIAHERTHHTPLTTVGMDAAVDAMRPVDLTLRGMFYDHLEAIANTWHGFGRAA